jgi:hypothetical protein
MDESKRSPPEPGKESGKPDEPAPSAAPGKEALAMIERAALAMADRKRPKRPPELSVAQTPPAGPEPPEAFIVDTPGMNVPRVSLKPPPAPPPQARAPIAPPPVADKASETRLIAEFDRLVGSAAVKPAPPRSPITPEPQAAPRSAIPQPEIGVTPANAAAALRPLFDDQFRLPLTRLQSAAAALAIGVLVIGAALLTARTWIVAQDWTCRTGVMTRLCPPVAMPKPKSLPELPT